jgi:choline dehydrogenase-like flavoprotein
MAESPKPSLVAPRNRSGQKRAIDILPDMLDDARRLGEGTEIDADICVIGAGPAGVTLASEWLADGFRVVMLESGGAFRKKAAQLLARGESAGQPYYRLERTRVRGFGGTSLHWRAGEGAVRCRPMDPLDFSNRPEVCRKGWPFGREHLDEFYERAHELCFLAPMDYTSEGAHDQPLEQVLLKELVTTREIQIGPTTSFTRRLERFARATNVRLLVNATVISLVCDDLGARIDSVLVAPDSTKRFSVRAKFFVLAAGGIENARLLLLSGGDGTSAIGNHSDLVGRNFMEHLHIRTGLLHLSGRMPDERVGSHGHRLVDGVSSMRMFTLRDEVLRREGLLGSAWLETPVSEIAASVAGRALLDLERGLPGRRLAPFPDKAWRAQVALSHPRALAQAAAHRLSRRRVPRPLFQLAVMAEQAPNRSSRVVLGHRRDPFGQPVARLEWRLSDVDRRSVRRTQDIVDAALRAAGAGHIEEKLGDERPPCYIEGGFHHMGTTRMSASPSDGVVDLNCRVHGVGNLFVAGSSVFPSVGYANPTLTIVALAVRLADHLRALLQPSRAATVETGDET